MSELHPTPQETAHFQTMGYEIDELGRPIRPDLLSVPNMLDLPTGRGDLWYWGPNYTADPIIITEEQPPHILLVKRLTGEWAAPGGFVDPGELPEAAVLREPLEETNHPVDSIPQLFYRGIVHDPRSTLHAWPETSAYLLRVPERYPVAPQKSEVKKAHWFRLDRLPKNLYGSHAELIERAKEVRKPSIEQLLNKPLSEYKTTTIEHGHMAYDHLIVDTPDGRLFAKAHDPAAFTDPVRELHSRTYLKKERDVYAYLSANGYPAIPSRFGLVHSNRTLALEALEPRDGWQWHAPDDEGFTKYMSDVLQQFDGLARIDAPKNDYHNGIDDTYATLLDEGWSSIVPARFPAVIKRIHELSAGWNDERQREAEQFIRALGLLQKTAAAQTPATDLVFSHGDARQSNIAWHPERGARFADWSWAGLLPRRADISTLLIDLHKAGRDVSRYSSLLNTEFVITYIGFLLEHSLWNTYGKSTTVREHQVASAISGYQLIKDLL